MACRNFRFSKFTRVTKYLYSLSAACTPTLLVFLELIKLNRNPQQQSAAVDWTWSHRAQDVKSLYYCNHHLHWIYSRQDLHSAWKSIHEFLKFLGDGIVPPLLLRVSQGRDREHHYHCKSYMDLTVVFLMKLEHQTDISDSGQSFVCKIYLSGGKEREGHKSLTLKRSAPRNYGFQSVQLDHCLLLSYLVIRCRIYRGIAAGEQRYDPLIKWTTRVLNPFSAPLVKVTDETAFSQIDLFVCSNVWHFLHRNFKCYCFRLCVLQYVARTEDAEAVKKQVWHL